MLLRRSSNGKISVSIRYWENDFFGGAAEEDSVAGLVWRALVSASST
jgi:hypothetical protein